MPTALLKSCLGCGKACDRDNMRNGRCKECAKPVDAANDRFRKDDPIRQLYLLARYGWRKFANHMLACNPVCQAMERHPQTFENVQCRDAATDVHHLVSPRTRRDLFKVPSNVVCLCKRHHHKSEGEPEGKRDPALYVPTLEGYGATGGIKAVN